MKEFFSAGEMDVAIIIAVFAFVGSIISLGWNIIRGKKQDFENTFFQTLHLHNSIIMGMEIIEPEGLDVVKTYKARDCFSFFYDEFKYLFDETVRESTEKKDLELINKAYEKFFDMYQDKAGHYFRNLYNIIKFVDQRSPRGRSKKFYTNFVRAQLSSSELGLLFYNCLSDYGNEKFKPLVEKYALLKNMPKRDDFLIEHRHKKFYRRSAFGE